MQFSDKIQEKVALELSSSVEGTKMYNNNQDVTLFEPAPRQLSLQKEQTSSLTSIHLDDALEIVQLSFINIAALSQKNQLITIELQADLKIFTILQRKNPQLADRWQGQILSTESMNHSPLKDVTGGVDLVINKDDKVVNGTITLNQQSYIIKPLGGNLHAICKQKRYAA